MLFDGGERCRTVVDYPDRLRCLSINDARWLTMSARGDADSRGGFDPQSLALVRLGRWSRSAGPFRPTANRPMSRWVRECRLPRSSMSWSVSFESSGCHALSLTAPKIALAVGYDVEDELLYQS